MNTEKYEIFFGSAGDEWSGKAWTPYHVPAVYKDGVLIGGVLKYTRSFGEAHGLKAYECYEAEAKFWLGVAACQETPESVEPGKWRSALVMGYWPVHWTILHGINGYISWCRMRAMVDMPLPATQEEVKKLIWRCKKAPSRFFQYAFPNCLFSLEEWTDREVEPPIPPGWFVVSIERREGCPEAVGKTWRLVAFVPED